jgi:hypothetical protein
MKLTRTQRRQIDKLARHVERVTDTDRVFLAASWSDTSRSARE